MEYTPNYNKKALPKHAYCSHLFISLKGTPLYTCRRASFTLEAAVILPLVAGFLVSLLFFFRLLQIQAAVESALSYAGRKTAAQVYIANQPATELAMAEVYFLKGLEQSELTDRYVLGGKIGISLLSSDFSEDYVSLQARYYVKLPIPFFSVKGISVVQNSQNKRWVGETAANGEEEVWVYVTPYGEVYHTSSRCPYLDLTIHVAEMGAVKNMRNRNGSRYEACMYCGGTGNGTVYVTDYGEVYHSTLSCTGLKRTIEKVLLSESRKDRLCSKCAHSQGGK